MESLEAQVFNEIDPVYLNDIDFGSEFHSLGFFTSDNGTDITLVDTYNQPFDFLSLKTVTLLLQHFFDDG
jgi:hypothetical protein